MRTLQEQMRTMEIVEEGRKLRLDVMDAANKFVATIVDNITQSNEAEHEVLNARMNELEMQMDQLLHQSKYSGVGPSTSVPTPLDSVASLLPQKEVPKVKQQWGQKCQGNQR